MHHYPQEAKRLKNQIQILGFLVFILVIKALLSLQDVQSSSSWNVSFCSISFGALYVLPTFVDPSEAFQAQKGRAHRKEPWVFLWTANIERLSSLVKWIIWSNVKAYLECLLTLRIPHPNLAVPFALSSVLSDDWSRTHSHRTYKFIRQHTYVQAISIQAQGLPHSHHPQKQKKRIMNSVLKFPSWATS